MYVPEHFGTVFPYMIVDRAEDFVSFLQDAFGAVETGRSTGPDGRIANVRMLVGTSAFMISEAQQMQAMPASYYVYVESVDATYAKALAAGAEKIMEPADMPYQDRQGGVRDPFGNCWWISRRLVEAPYDD